MVGLEGLHGGPGKPAQVPTGGKEVVARFAGVCMSMVTDPPTLFPRLARDHTDDGGTIIGISSLPLPLIGAAPGRIGGIAMRGAFFPPRCGTTRRLRRQCPPSQPSVPSHGCWPGYAAGACGAVCVRAPARGRGGRSARPWSSHAVTALRAPGAAAFSQRPSRSAGCHSPRRLDSDRRENGLGHGTRAARSAHSADSAGHPGGDAVQAKACKGCHPIARRSESLSYDEDAITSTVATHELPALYFLPRNRIEPLPCSRSRCRYRRA